MLSANRVLWASRAVSAAAVYVMLLSAAQAGSSSWNGLTTYEGDMALAPEWTTTANWTGDVVPNGVGNIATFSNLTGRLNFQLATDITLGGLNVTSQRIDSRGVAVRTFTWDNNGSEAVINHPSSEFLLDHNHLLTDSVKIAKTGGQTRFSRLVSGPGGFILSGNQELILGETATVNTFAGGVTFLDTSRVDVRLPTATGTGDFTFASTSGANSTITPRGNWSGAAFANDVVVATGGFGRFVDEGNDADREFSGNVSGGGGLTLQPKNSLWQFTGDNTGFTGSLTISGANGSILTRGVGGVFNSAATISLLNAAVFPITSANAISDSATVNLDATSFFEVDSGLNVLIGSGLLTVNGSLIADGTYTNTESWIGGPGTITVVPEPSAWLLSAIGMLGLLLWRRRQNA